MSHSSGSHFQSYQPYPDDLLDGKLAGYLQNNPKHIPLFCRLSHGTYLYGTHRVSLRLVNKGTSQIIEALDASGKWIELHMLLKDKV